MPPQVVAAADAAAFRLCLVLVGIAAAASLAGLELPLRGRWIEGLVFTGAAVASLLALARRLPLQNLVAIGFVLYLTSMMALSVGTRWGVALGRFEFTDALGLRLLGLVPWSVPFLWVALVIASRSTAKVILRPWRRGKRYGWVLLGVTILLVLLQTAVLDPFGHRVMRWWIWTDTGTGLRWFGAPVTLFSDCAILSALLLLLATAWLIPKRPTGGTAEFEPVWIWLGLLLWFTLGTLRAGLWGPAACGAVAGGLVFWLARRGRGFVFNPPVASAGAPA